MNNLDVSNLITGDTLCISDTHFGHSKVIDFEPKRLELSSQLGYGNDWESALINSINDSTGYDKPLLMLGDFAFKAIEYYSKKLTAKNKVIILGNHDRKAPLYKSYGWEVFDGIVYDTGTGAEPFVLSDNNISLLSGLVKSIEGQRVLFSHYPVFDDNKHDRKNERIRDRSKLFETMYNHFNCSINIHGHVHSMRSSFDHSFNVSCEALDFIPVTLNSILQVNSGDLQ